MAAEAGMAVLRRGGSAVDAAVAVQAVLGLVEPQSSGLGGGAFMVHYDAETGAITVYDGRETAPASVTPELFMRDGRPEDFRSAVLSGRSVGTPGAVAMLAMAQADHGRLAWSGLFNDAERLARDGFVVPPRLGTFINMSAETAPQSHTAWADAYFERPDGTRPRAGDVLTNRAYAETVRRLAAEGPDYFYRGGLARQIVAAVQDGNDPGGLTLADLADKHLVLIDSTGMGQRDARVDAQTQMYAHNAANGGRSISRILVLAANTAFNGFPVLGSILGGIATPTESESVGAVGAIVLGYRFVIFLVTLYGT